MPRGWPRSPTSCPSPLAADGRFAPSPTGTLHLGNLRTALLAWLFARSAGGRFLMRMEDLDRGRVRPGIEERQLADLAALGIDWDGPVVRQSERLPLYDEAIARLEHPRIVRLLDHGEHGGLPYLVMEFIPGETLQQRLDRVGPVEPIEVVRVGAASAWWRARIAQGDRRSRASVGAPGR